MGVEVEAVDTTDIVAAPQNFFFYDKPSTDTRGSPQPLESGLQG